MGPVEIDRPGAHGLKGGDGAGLVLPPDVVNQASPYKCRRPYAHTPHRGFAHSPDNEIAQVDEQQRQLELFGVPAEKLSAVLGGGRFRHIVGGVQG